MIRQHFFPKTQIRKRTNKSKRCHENSQNEPWETIKDGGTISNANFVFIDPQLTQFSQPEQSQNRHKRKRQYSLIKPMHSAVLNSHNKQKRKEEGKHFLLQSRRKQICSPYNASRSITTVYKERLKTCGRKGDRETLDLGLQRRKKERKSKDRAPLSFRLKWVAGQERHQNEPKVRGWQTFVDDFVGFM